MNDSKVEGSNKYFIPPISLSISIRTKNKMNEDDDEFGDSIDWSAIPLNTIGASMAVPTPMGMTSHAMGGNYSSASNNNYHQHQTMTNNIGGAMHHTVGNNGATSSTTTAAATSVYNNNSVYQQPPQNGQNYSTGMGAGMGATNFSTNSVNEYGNSNDAEALRRQVSNSIELYKKMTLHI